VVFNIKTDDLRFYTQDMKFAAEPGDFKAMVGPNSADVKAVAFKVK
jgi:beta-glucosidase